ncbi:MAG: hypothetical protein LBB11_02250 [Puniceicoccales bacterium]|jgi:hypothetical protein|nr:hypothetical protein [Puniceicoccales bacterium]
MKKIPILLLLFQGCASEQIAEDTADTALPWNRPASWELKRDISTSMALHKTYGHDIFNRNLEKVQLKTNFKESQTQLQMTSNSSEDARLRSRIIDHHPELPSANPTHPVEVVKTYSE